MADIFGWEISDYKHLCAIDKPAYLQRLQQERDIQYQSSHNFNVLDTITQYYSSFRIEGDKDKDIAYMQDNIRAIQSQIDEIFYNEFRLAQTVPLTIGINANDINIIPPYYPATVNSPNWSSNAITDALRRHSAVDCETIQNTARNVVRYIEQIGLWGLQEYGIKGLLNQPASEINQLPNDYQVRCIDAMNMVENMSANDMLNFLQTSTNDLITHLEKVYGRVPKGELCIYMPPSAVFALVNTRLPNGDISIWDYFSRTNSWVHYVGQKTILQHLRELSFAGRMIGGSHNRYVLAVKEKNVMEMDSTVIPRVERVQRRAPMIISDIECKPKALRIKMPQSITYIDPR